MGFFFSFFFKKKKKIWSRVGRKQDGLKWAGGVEKFDQTILYEILKE